ncbi:CLUMA_CG010894, isoform A [Clunio marinus]|uniref:CLUMA_CG010894, isoform A n=1 Tax=Clunio marinus TaxID=568069 RepID=A0A1J1IGC6_9DIPT|nr:CLUMA_CG010894, isoform A [Clunio marinus]
MNFHEPHSMSTVVSNESLQAKQQNKYTLTPAKAYKNAVKIRITDSVFLSLPQEYDNKAHKLALQSYDRISHTLFVFSHNTPLDDRAHSCLSKENSEPLMT